MAPHFLGGVDCDLPCTFIKRHCPLPSFTPFQSPLHLLRFTHQPSPPQHPPHSLWPPTTRTASSSCTCGILRRAGAAAGACGCLCAVVDARMHPKVFRGSSKQHTCSEDGTEEEPQPTPVFPPQKHRMHRDCVPVAEYPHAAMPAARALAQLCEPD